MSKTNQLAAHLTPQELHWNKTLSKLTVSILKVVTKFPPDHEADPSEIISYRSPEMVLKIDRFLVFSEVTKVNESAHRFPAIKAKLDKNSLLIIAIKDLAGLNSVCSLNINIYIIP